MKTLPITFASCAFLISGTPSFPYCSEPSFYALEPSFFLAMSPSAPSFYAKPSVPYCLSEYNYSGVHTCEDYEISSYFDEVNDYIEDLNTYVQEARQFADEATDYANRAINFAGEVQQFSNEVYDYSNCEAEDVKAQHE